MNSLASHRTPLLVLAVLALAAGAWLVLRPAPRSAGAHAAAAEGGAPAAARVAELAAADAGAVGEALRPAGAPEADAAPRESLSEDVPFGPVRGRLVRAEDGDALAGEWRVLLASPGDRVAESVLSRADGRFESTRRFPRGELRAFVTDPAGGERRARHAARFDPEAAGEWLVPVPRAEGDAPPTTVQPPERAFLVGRVVDLARRPVAGAQVRALPLVEGGELRFAESGSQGEFQLDLPPGRYRLRAHARFATSASLELALAGGQNDAGDLLLPFTGGGALRGRIVFADQETSPPFLRLRDVASGREIAEMGEWKLFGKDDDGISEFEIPDVPAGEYELSVVTLEGHAFEPASLRVSPPAEGLEFRALPAPTTRYRLVVLDAVSGAELEDFTCMLSIHGQWIGGEGSPLDDFDTMSAAWDPWIVFDPAHRPARVRLAEATPAVDADGAPCLEVRARLAPGHGQALVFKDLDSDRFVLPELGEAFVAPGLAGVRVLADGVLAATSDADGLALLDLAAPPRELVFEHPGRRVLGEEKEDGMRFVYLARE